MVKQLIVFLLIGTSFVGGVSRHVKPRHRWHYTSIIAGSHESMDIQNREIDKLQLPRISDDNQLHSLESQGELVRISSKVEVATNLRDDRKYLRPWAELFLEDMAYEFSSKWNIRLRVNSAVRTMEQQHELRKHNKYAAPESRSSHLAGITFDLSKKYNKNQRKWIVNYLYNMRQKGYITVAEEPNCYHIVVFERYNEILSSKL